MPTITRLVQQQKKQRVNVYMDGAFGFAITLESALEHNLTVGKELLQEEIEKLRGDDFEDKVFARLISFVSSRPHSKREIERWFRKKNVEVTLQKTLFNRLNNIGLVNDEEFAKWWVEQRVHFRSSPPKMIRVELRAKGIDDHIIDQVLQLVESPSEQTLAKKVLIKRFGKIPQPVDLKEKKRVYDFLLRRGFSYQVIKEVLTDNSTEEYN